MPVTKAKHIITVSNDKAVEAPETASTVRTTYMSSHSTVELKLHAYDDKAIEIFDEMPHELLPILPYGYQWATTPDEGPSIIKWDGIPDYQLDMVLYGPEKGRINYVFLVDDITWQSFAHTRNGKEPDREYPMTANDYKVDKSQEDLPELVDEADLKSVSDSYLRGHCIDHKDTMPILGKANFSTYHAWNYIPESRYKFWGLHMRRVIVDDLRRGLNGYMQYVHYPEAPFVTKNGTLVPDFLYFYNVKIDRSVPLDEGYRIGKVFNIDWDVNYNTPHKESGKKVLEFSDKFTTSRKSAPKSTVFSPSSSSKAMRKLLTDLDISEHRSLNRDRDQYFALKAQSELKLDNINADLELALQASKLDEAKTATQAIDMGVSYGHAVSHLDRPIKIFDKNIFTQIKTHFKDEAPGFEDKDDTQVDELSQLFKNQAKI